jgi:hypothetical protein
MEIEERLAEEEEREQKIRDQWEVDEEDSRGRGDLNETEKEMKSRYVEDKFDKKSKQGMMEKYDTIYSISGKLST